MRPLKQTTSFVCMWNLSQKQRAASNWNAAVEPEQLNVNWWHVPEIVGNYNEKICGSPVGGDNAAGCRETLRQRWPGRKFERAVSIACGLAAKEAALCEENLVNQVDLFDTSEGRVAKAKAMIRDRGLVGQLNFLEDDPVNDWSPRYDLVYWDHALHHMFDVEKYISWSKSVLNEGGVILINDYVGPNRLQWSRKNVKICRDLVGEFTKELDIKIKNKTPLTRLMMYIRDPSEAAESEKIIPFCNEHLKNCQVVPIGGYLYLVIGRHLGVLTQLDGFTNRMLEIDNQLHRNHFHYAFILWEKVAS